MKGQSVDNTQLNQMLENYHKRNIEISNGYKNIYDK